MQVPPFVRVSIISRFRILPTLSAYLPSAYRLTDTYLTYKRPDSGLMSTWKYRCPSSAEHEELLWPARSSMPWLPLFEDRKWECRVVETALVDYVPSSTVLGFNTTYISITCQACFIFQNGKGPSAEDGPSLQKRSNPWRCTPHSKTPSEGIAQVMVISMR